MSDIPLFLSPLQLSVPRLSYLPLAASPRVRKYFESNVQSLMAREELWYSCLWNGERIPLKWHYPIGVLYDLYGLNALPWTVTVHFAAFPAERLLRCPDEETVKSAFLNALKQATFLKFGDLKTFNELSVLETTDLWAGVVRDEPDRFWRACRLLSRDRRRDSFLRLPFRLLRPSSSAPSPPLPTSPPSASASASGLRSGPVVHMMQEPLSPFAADGVELTLGALLERLAPDTIRRDPMTSSGWRCLHPVAIAGLRVPLETSALWIALNLCAPDNWVYVAVADTS